MLGFLTLPVLELIYEAELSIATYLIPVLRAYGKKQLHLVVGLLDGPKRWESRDPEAIILQQRNPILQCEMIQEWADVLDMTYLYCWVTDDTANFILQYHYSKIIGFGVQVQCIVPHQKARFQLYADFALAIEKSA